MTLNSVWRLLSIWKGQGIVKPRRGIVEIHNLPRLLSFAELVDALDQNAGPGGEIVASGAMIAGINDDCAAYRPKKKRESPYL
jgi:hypothetical protein